MEDPHAPSPEFSRFLEWQTRTALRRDRRFSESSSPSGALQRMTRVAALVLVSLFVGAGAVVAAERIQESRALDVLLAQNQLRLELAQRRVEAARKVEETTRVRVSQGIAPQASVRRVTLRVAELEREATRLQLDRDELAAAQREVDRRISAPLVRGRDFVHERLRVDADYRARMLEIHEKDEASLKIQYQSGMIPRGELRQAQRVAAASRAESARLTERMALRAEFVAGQIDGVTCERRDRIAAAEHRGRVLDAEAEHLRTSLEEARVFEANGLASGLVAPLELELEALEVEQGLVELELELLR